YRRELKMVEKGSYISKDDKMHLWSSLADISSKQGHMAEAERRLRKCIPLAEQQIGRNSMPVAGLSMKLAYCCAQQNHYDDAIAAYKRALRIHQMFQPNGLCVSDDLSAISVVYQDKHDYLQSDAIEKQALTIRLRLCQANDPRVIE